jgi:hypothetical protein
MADLQDQIDLRYLSEIILGTENLADLVPKNSKVTLEALTQLAISIKLKPGRKKKPELLMMVKTRLMNRTRLDVLRATESDSEDENAGPDDLDPAATVEGFVAHRKDKNTFPRLCNFLLKDPDALQRTRLLATKQQLQDREIQQNLPIFNRATDQFNDRNAFSGNYKISITVVGVLFACRWWCILLDLLIIY